MKKSFDPELVRKTLQHGIDKGYWTRDSLDEPSPGFRSNMNVHIRDFPSGYRGVRHKNLLRDS
tara:strand:+ start:202 stop:390 length:189 start_codon:yes stop_codon:yes gene_type:complete